MLDVMRTGGEWGGGGSHRLHTEITADSSTEMNNFSLSNSFSLLFFIGVLLFTCRVRCCYCQQQRDEQFSH